MANEKKEPAHGKRILMKDNILIRTKYDLTLVENKLYNLILYKFQKEGEVLKCTITPEEIREVVKKKSENSTKKIGEVLDKLSTKKIWIEEKKANGINNKWHKYNLLNGCTYDDEFKTFEVQATAFIYELIKKKFDNGGYTPINMNIFLTLGNYYSQRLYDLLRLWSNTKTVINYSVDELKELLMVADKYPLYADFKRRVINPAIKELNKSGAFDIEIKELKEGRKVTSIDFIVKDLDKRKYFENIPFVEVPTVLKDGAGEDVEVMQQAINIDAVEDENKIAPAGATAEANKFVCLPDNILSPEASQDFINYCYKENYSFTDIDFNRILSETQEATKGKKGLNKGELIDNKLNNSYSLFKKIFINKMEQHERTETVDIIPQYTAPADATASEEGQGVELPSWIQNLNNYDK